MDVDDAVYEVVLLLSEMYNTLTPKDYFKAMKRLKKEVEERYYIAEAEAEQ